MITSRPDLPPIARELDLRIAGARHDLAGLDDRTAAAISALGSQLLNAVAELENDQIISRGIGRKT